MLGSFQLPTQLPQGEIGSYIVPSPVDIGKEWFGGQRSNGVTTSLKKEKKVNTVFFSFVILPVL
jgi:hypothetical protein